MKLFKRCFMHWRELISYDGTDPEFDLEDYENIFWNYLNYSYIRPEWSIKNK